MNASLFYLNIIFYQVNYKLRKLLNAHARIGCDRARLFPFFAAQNCETCHLLNKMIEGNYHCFRQINKVFAECAEFMNISSANDAQIMA